ncbi:MAG TPA: hypothetical protein VFS40_09750 [Gemmatimonadales bacterium]|nr:hypothetical protein [Gemmatimonadales bacterium]
MRPRLRAWCVPGLLLLAAVPGRAVGQASGQLNATAKVLPGIGVSSTPLDFGTVTPSQARTIAPQVGGRVQILLTKQGAVKKGVTVGYTLPATLGPRLALSGWSARRNTVNDPATATAVGLVAPSGSFSALTDTGELYLWIGATLTTTNAAPGSYSGLVTLTVAYN